MKETALGLLIPEVGDPPAGPAQIGGNAERADALIQKGGVGAHFYTAATLTRASTAYGSFSTPVKVELPKVAADQIIDIYLMTWCKQQEPHAFLRVAVGGEGTIKNVNFGESALEVTGENGKFKFVRMDALEGPIGAGEQTESQASTNANLLAGNRISPGPAFSVKNKSAEAKPLVIELQGKAASGTVSLIGAYLAAHVRA